MKTLRTILFGVLALAAIVALATFLLPAKVTLQREAEIDRSPSLIYAFVSDINGFNQFSPWKRADPAMTSNVAGNPGAGQKMTWQSKKMGNGSMTIAESKPYESVTYDLDFGRSKAKSSFIITPAAKGSKVVWTMESYAGVNPVERVMNFGRSGLIAKEFGGGLDRGAGRAEGWPDVDLSGLNVSRLTTQRSAFIFVPIEVSSADPAAAEAELLRAMNKANAVLILNDLSPSGPGVIQYTDISNGMIKANAGFPMDKAPTPEEAAALIGSAKVVFGELPGGAMVRAPAAPHTGDKIMEKLQVYLKLMRLSKKGDVQQAYPGGVNGETEVLIPIG